MLAAERLESRHLLAAIPPGFEHATIASGLTFPTAMDVAEDGRIFVAEKGGVVRVIKDGTLLPERFLRVDAAVAGEYGLVGIALDPDFITNGHVFVYYTSTSTPTQNVIERFTANGDTANPDSRVRVFSLDEVNPPGVVGNYHIGGALQFGGDGMLYVATGDAATPSNSQNLGTTHGKLLRIGPDGTIPADNPFFDSAVGANRAIWATGLRNPFSFAVHPWTGEIFINDVGQSGWEEINLGRPGANYGWPITEGPTSDPRFDAPLYAYGHEADAAFGGRGPAAIAGGAFYVAPAATIPSEYVGRYFFADFVRKSISTFDPATRAVELFATDVAPPGTYWPVDIDIGPDGGIYYLIYGPNPSAVMRISPRGDTAPVIGTQPSDVAVSAGGSATFTATAFGSGPLGFQWQRAPDRDAEFEDIPGATSPTLAVAGVDRTMSGARFRVVVTNPHGTARSSAATLTVTERPPASIRLSAPHDTGLFAMGETVRFESVLPGMTGDPSPMAAVTWQADMIHGNVVRPLVPRTFGTTGSFTIPSETPYTRTDIVVRISVSVLSGEDREVTTHVDLNPRTARFVLASHPAGLPLQLDGTPQPALSATAAVVGFRRTISAPEYAVSGGSFLRFVGWDHGGQATQTISVPEANAVYTARYVPSSAYVERYADANPEFFAIHGGEWTTPGPGRFRGTPTGDTPALALFEAPVHLPNRVAIDAELNVGAASGGGLVVFGATEADDFLYAGLATGVPRLVIGRYSADGWNDLVVGPIPDGSGAILPLTVRIVGGAVTLEVDGRPVLTHDFLEPRREGRVGVAVRESTGEFGSFRLRLESEPDRPVITYDDRGEILVNGVPVTFGGHAVRFDNMLDSGFTPAAAAVIDALPTMVWRHRSGALHFWRLDDAWRHVSSDGWILPGTAQAAAVETACGVDLDGDGVVGLGLQPVGLPAGVELTRSQDGFLHAAGVGVTFLGVPVNVFRMIDSGFTPAAADVIDGRPTIVWHHRSGALHFWRLDDAWSHVSSDGWILPATAAYVAAEATFAVAFSSFSSDSSGQVVTPPVPITLALSSQGFLFADGKAVRFQSEHVNFFAMIESGFTAIVARVIDGRNTIIWRHASRALHFWRLDDDWRHVSSDGWMLPGTAQAAAVETAYGVDLDGDGVVGIVLEPVGVPAGVALTRSQGGFLYAAGVGVTFHGMPVNVFMVIQSGFTPVAADVVDGRNTITWRHTSGAIHYWRLDAAWRHVSSDGWVIT